VTVNIIKLQNVSISELQNIRENVGLHELDKELQGDSIDFTIIKADEIGENEERDEDYLLPFTC